MRKEKFIENLERIKKHNKRYQQKLETYAQGITEFADLTPEEFEKCQKGFDFETAKVKWGKLDLKTFTNIPNVIIPEYKNWLAEGAVIKEPRNDTYKCRSSWAFSAVTTIEAVNFLKTQKLVQLSLQNLIDCTYNTGNKGCSGGWYGGVFEYVISNRGIDTEESYRYIASTNNKCLFEPNGVGAQISQYLRIEQDEEALKIAVAEYGPVSVAVNNHCFHRYKDGIIDCKPCGARLNHAVTIIGYGSDKGLDYWLIRNCWGNRWGESGNARMIRNKNNQCGIVSMGMLVEA